MRRLHGLPPLITHIVQVSDPPAVALVYSSLVLPRFFLVSINPLILPIYPYMIYTFIFLSTYPTAPTFIPFFLHFADITTSQSCPFFFHFSVDPLLVPVLLSIYDFLYFPIKFSEWRLIHFHPIDLKFCTLLWY